MPPKKAAPKPKPKPKTAASAPQPKPRGGENNGKGNSGSEAAGAMGAEELEQLLGHRILGGDGLSAPLQDDYVVPRGGAVAMGQQQQQQQNEFAGVRVTRGTLATFGDDTAMQFAMHIDKMLKEGRGGLAAGKGDERIPSLLVRNGDICSRAAVLRNDAVPIFERQMGALLNPALRRGAGDVRQREDDDGNAAAAAAAGSDDD